MENLDEVIGTLKDFQEGRHEDAQSLAEKLLEDDPGNLLLNFAPVACQLCLDSGLSG